MNKHTKLSWQVESGAITTAEEPSRPIARMVRDESATAAGICPTERDDNAKFIVVAVNNHQKMLDLLNEFCDIIVCTESDMACEYLVPPLLKARELMTAINLQS